MPTLNQPGAGTNPFVYLERLEKWSDAGTVLRFIVSDTPVNAAVILDPIRYREQDGTNDIYCTIPLRGYRRCRRRPWSRKPPGTRPELWRPSRKNRTAYTVQAGDTLSGIARRFYGDASLYGKLAAANGICNPNRIYPGQVLKLPDADKLPAARAAEQKPLSQKAAEATAVTFDQTVGQFKFQAGPAVKNLAQEALNRLEG